LFFLLSLSVSQVVSLLGSFTVAILSFVLPPVFHLFIITIPKMEKHKSAISMINKFSSHEEEDENEIKNQYYRGVAHSLGGIALSIVATMVTTSYVIEKLYRGESCA
jgi:hypothetical protein